MIDVRPSASRAWVSAAKAVRKDDVLEVSVPATPALVRARLLRALLTTPLP